MKTVMLRLAGVGKMSAKDCRRRGLFVVPIEAGGVAQTEADVLRFSRMSHTITVRLGAELAKWLEETAAQSGVSQGQLIREQLQKAKANGSRKGFMRLSGSLRGLPKDLSAREGFSPK